MDLPDVAVQVSIMTRLVLTNRTLEGLLTGVGGEVALVLLAVVGLVLAVRTVELENASMVVFAVNHHIQLHESVTAFIASVRVITCVNSGVIL